MHPSIVNHPRLRSDLDWTLHDFADGPSYTVSDPLTGMNYQVGLAEQALVSLFDGDTSIHDAARATQRLAQRTGDETFAISEQEAEKIATWFVRTGLVTNHLGSPVASAKKHRKPRISALVIKTPIGDPQRLIQCIVPWTRPLTTRLFLVAAIGIICFAISQVIGDLHGWSAAMQPLWDPSQWLILGVAALALRVVHEAAHAIVADRFDVRVREVGILWILFVPLPYVDVSESWRRGRRAERILIAGSGMLAELTIAAIAVLVFVWTPSDQIRHTAAMIALAASAVTVLFNANVLMRFDGYHMLVDATGLPNLYADASGYWHALCKRLVLGTASRACVAPGGWRGVLFRLYGAAVILWRVVVFVSLVLAAEFIFSGLGVLLSIIAVVTLVVVQLQHLRATLSGTRPVRAAIGIAVAASLLFAVWSLPLPVGRGEVGVVRYRDPESVRAAASGFVRRIAVARGQTVRHGDVLAQLQNLELETEVAGLEQELNGAIVQYRQLLATNQASIVAAVWSDIKNLRLQVSERRRQLESLTIRAQTDGVVTADGDLQTWLGRYVQEGAELMRVVRYDDVELVSLVDQKDRDHWSRQIGKFTFFRPHGFLQARGQAMMTEIAPVASDELPSAALGANQGGPLVVQPHETLPNEVRLICPRFEIRLKPANQPPSKAGPLKAGQTVFISLENSAQTLGQWATETASQWIGQRLARHSVLRQWTSF